MSAVLNRFPNYNTWYASHDPFYDIDCLLKLYTTNMPGNANLDEFIETLGSIFSKYRDHENTRIPVQWATTPSYTAHASTGQPSLLECTLYSLLLAIATAQQPVQHSLFGIATWMQKDFLKQKAKEPKIQPEKCRAALLKLAEMYPNHPAFKQLAKHATETLLCPSFYGKQFELDRTANGSCKILGTAQYLRISDLELLAFFYGPKLREQLQLTQNRGEVFANLAQLITNTFLCVGTKTLYVRDIVTDGPGISYGGGLPMSLESRPVTVPEVYVNTDKIAEFIALFDVAPEPAPVPEQRIPASEPVPQPEPAPQPPEPIPTPERRAESDPKLEQPHPVNDVVDQIVHTHPAPALVPQADAVVPQADPDMHRDQPDLRVDWWGCRFM